VAFREVKHIVIIDLLQAQGNGNVQRNVVTSNQGGVQTIHITEVISGGNDMINMMPSGMPLSGGLIISKKNLKRGNGVAKINPIRIFSGNF
jgi:hypothetical protein